MKSILTYGTLHSNASCRNAAPLHPWILGRYTSVVLLLLIGGK